MTRRYFRLTRFARLIIVLMVTLTLLTVIPIAVGRARNEPNELEALGFGVCDGRPCFMGIVPGVTTWIEAVSFVKKHGGIDSTKYLSLDIHSLGVAFYPTEDLSLVGGIQLEPSQIQIPVGQVFQLFGVPCSIIVDRGMITPNGVTLRYHSMSVTVEDYGLFSPSSYIARGFIHIRSDLCVHQDDEFVNFSPWIGFASHSRYRAYN
jgi:hypothetical protein